MNWHLRNEQITIKHYLWNEANFSLNELFHTKLLFEVGISVKEEALAATEDSYLFTERVLLTLLKTSEEIGVPLMHILLHMNKLLISLSKMDFTDLTDMVFLNGFLRILKILFIRKLHKHTNFSLTLMLLKEVSCFSNR
jgi:hypothetical protein